MSRYDIRKMSLNDFYCTKCGNKAHQIWRKNGNERGAGHLKKIYCLNCKESVNHVECIPWSKYTYEDFLCEFNANNFTEEGLRKIPYNILKEKLENEENK